MAGAGRAAVMSLTLGMAACGTLTGAAVGAGSGATAGTIYDAVKKK